MSRAGSDHVSPDTWIPVQRAAQAIAAPVHRFLAIEAASGIVLLAATVAAIVWANTWTASYDALWHTPFGFQVGDWWIARPLEFWINDGLMTIFFFLVGLEIRRELFEGELSSVRKAALPLAAAIGGILIPAAVFFALNAGRTTEVGWAIPMATDIAFAVGVLTLLGSRVPVALRVLLLALAVVDDIAAIVVIGAFYSSGISVAGIAVAFAGTAMVLLVRSAGVRAPLAYVIPGSVLWIGLLGAGIHPTVAGVVLGLLTPARQWLGPSGFAAMTEQQLQQLPEDREELMASLDRIDYARREAVSPVERLIHSLHPWVAYLVMPLFALANAGVVLGDARLDGDAAWLFAGILAGLVLGKPLGIIGAALLASRLGVATRAVGVPVRGVVLVGLVGGIGFTMSLFIAQLAFPPGPLLDTAKLAILIGSGIAIAGGLVFGAWSAPRRAA